MPTARLDREILDHLIKKTGLAEQTIRNNISKLRSEFPSATLNGLAQIFSKKHGFSILNRLRDEDKTTIPITKFENKPISIWKSKKKKKIKATQLIKYETDDYFIQGHILEFNKAYNLGIYTAAHILARKIIENLIREILSNKYPSTSKSNKELYFDPAQKRFKDFNQILKNLRKKRHEFGPEKAKMIERLYDLAIAFKKDANDATHSWYHLVKRKKELEDLNIPIMLELIKKIQH